MGQRGPTPTPTAILNQRGSWRAKARKGEPKPAKGMPTCPGWLSKEAKAAWKQVVQELKLTGVLTKADGNALARYCSLWVRWIRASQFIEQYGESYPLKDGNGNVKCFGQFPQVAVVNKLSVLLLRLEQEFGLTPSARTRINVDVSAEPDAQGKGRFFKVVG